jgi:hypothetical protein
LVDEFPAKQHNEDPHDWEESIMASALNRVTDWLPVRPDEDDETFTSWPDERTPAPRLGRRSVRGLQRRSRNRRHPRLNRRLRVGLMRSARCRRHIFAILTGRDGTPAGPAPREKHSKVTLAVVAV